MGTITDIVVARREDAETVLHAESPTRSFPGSELRCVGPTELGLLLAILRNEPFDPAWPSTLPLLAGGDDEGSVVLEISGDLAALLARLDQAELAAVGARWAATAELEALGATSMTAMVSELVSLARTATAQGLVMMLYWLP